MVKNTDRKNNSGREFVIVGLILIVAALFLSLKNMRDITRATVSSQTVMGELMPVVEAAREKNTAAQTRENAAETVISDYILNPDMEMPTEWIDGNEYIGVISIPDIGIILPVMERWSYPNLNVSPCRYNGTAYKKNFVICAHNYETHFGNLKYLDVGEPIIFTDVAGNEFNYEVAEVDTLQPTAIEEMTSGDWDLTLFTCTIGGASRVTVRCMLQEKERQLVSYKNN